MKLKSLLVFAGGFLTCAALAGAVIAGVFFLSIRFGGDEYLSEEIPVSINGAFVVTLAGRGGMYHVTQERREYIFSFLSELKGGKVWEHNPASSVMQLSILSIHSSYNGRSVLVELSTNTVRIYTYTGDRRDELIMEYPIPGGYDRSQEIYNYLASGFSRIGDIIS